MQTWGPKAKQWSRLPSSNSLVQPLKQGFCFPDHFLRSQSSTQPIQARIMAMSLRNQQIAVNHMLYSFLLFCHLNQHVRCVRLLPLPAGYISLPQFNCSKCEKRVHQSRMMRTLVLCLHMHASPHSQAPFCCTSTLNTAASSCCAAHIDMLRAILVWSSLRHALHVTVDLLCTLWWLHAFEHGMSMSCMLCRSH